MEQDTHLHYKLYITHVTAKANERTKKKRRKKSKKKNNN